MFKDLNKFDLAFTLSDFPAFLYCCYNWLHLPNIYCSFTFISKVNRVLLHFQAMHYVPKMWSFRKNTICIVSYTKLSLCGHNFRCAFRALVWFFPNLLICLAWALSSLGQLSSVLACVSQNDSLRAFYWYKWPGLSHSITTHGVLLVCWIII